MMLFVHTMYLTDSSCIYMSYYDILCLYVTIVCICMYLVYSIPLTKLNTRDLELSYILTFSGAEESMKSTGLLGQFEFCVWET